ncbi:Hypothetical predicted protein [Olea europaea subsp. europaea]|uniref:Uncharacterized protein n=1 Tax=Olea europaea subsp. europaea TaxID=158383 RepID=A0A8S0URN3_OLEEU|nr:Hypothetical predicted protein [Olea europaea subsp. europaea]
MTKRKPVKFEPESRPEPTAAQVNKTPSSTPAPKKPQYQFSKPPMISSSEEEDEYESDWFDPNVKPLASNPMVVSEKSTSRKISEPSATGPGISGDVNWVKTCSC